MPGIWRRIYKGLLAFCVLVTLILMVGVATHFPEIEKGARIYSLLRSQSLNYINTDQLFEGAIRGMVEALDDPYSTYLDAETYSRLKESVSGIYGGVGLLITLDEKERLIVVSPFKGTPAQRAGIKSEDHIIAIDGQETTAINLEMAANMMQGEPGTTVELIIQSNDSGDTHKITLERELIKIPTVEGQMLSAHPGIGYLSLSMFNEQTGPDLGQELQKLQQQGAERLILDLRNNPGGALPAAVDVASYFIPEGPIVYIADRQGSEAMMARGYGQTIPLVVLVNKGSASAAEIVAGAIKDAEAGLLVGETTFGKGIVQTIFPLPGETAVKFTTHKYLTPAKKDINKKGIMPDYEVLLDSQLEHQVLSNAPDLEQDLQLQKALSLLAE